MTFRVKGVNGTALFSALKYYKSASQPDFELEFVGSSVTITTGHSVGGYVETSFYAVPTGTNVQGSATGCFKYID